VYTPNKIQLKYISNKDTTFTGYIGFDDRTTRKLVTNLDPFTTSESPAGILVPPDGTILDINIADASIVIAPEVTITTSNRYFPKLEQIRLEGTNFNLISEIYFEHANRILECTIDSRSNTVIDIIPQEMIGTADLIIKSQTNNIKLSCIFYNYVTLTSPSASQSPVKGLIRKQNNSIVISGTNLDQVSYIMFDDEVALITKRTLTEITVIPPVSRIESVVDIVAVSKYGYNTTLYNAYKYQKNL
jgi:hypothetical protein